MKTKPDKQITNTERQKLFQEIEDAIMKLRPHYAGITEEASDEALQDLEELQKHMKKEIKTYRNLASKTRRFQAASTNK